MIKKLGIKPLLIVLCLLHVAINIYAQTPTIQSFSPLSANTGSNILIQGTNFGNNPAAVSVWFGPVKGQVIQLSSTQITARVPVGAAAAPVIVWKDSLFASSSRLFTPLFNANNAAFDPFDFTEPQLQAPGLNPFVFDFDMDGKPDYSAVKGSNQLVFYRNNSDATRFDFSPSFTLTPNNRVIDQAAADFNGDQKPDLALIVQNFNFSYISIYPNTGTPGNIQFGTPIIYNLGSDYPFSLCAADIDGNGKADLIVGYSSSGNAFSVVRQTGTNGNIAFAPKTNISFGTGGVGTNNKVVLADLDGDNKQDVAVLGSYYRPIFVYRNTSTIGTATFASKITIETGRPNVITGRSYDLRIADMDGDLKSDLIMMHGDADTISLFRNTGSSGVISFASRWVKQTPSVSGAMIVGDLNGDAKPDIAYLNNYDSAYIIRNTSASGSFQLETGVRVQSLYPMQTIHLQDFDLDQKPDIMVSGTDFGGRNIHQLGILRNRFSGPVIQYVEPITADSGTILTVKGKRFSNVQSVRLGQTNAASFQVIHDSLMQVVVGNGSSGSVNAQSSLGQDAYPGFTYSLPIPRIDSFTPKKGPLGTWITIYGNKFSTQEDVKVRIGSVSAKVISANWNSIVAEVPVGTNTMPITVNIPSRKLQAQTNSPFVVTYPGADSLITNQDFGDTLQRELPSYGTNILAQDLDGDAKSDIALPIYFNTNKISVFRNQTDSTPLFFDARQDWSTYSGSFGGGSGNVVGLTSADIDGDSRFDLISVSAFPDSLSVFINQSDSGLIRFARKVDFTTGSDPTDLVSGDLDLDGKPDLVCTNATAGTISVYKNITDSSGVKMLPRFDSASNIGSQSLLMQDLNGDRLPDLIITNYNNNRITVYQNNSTCGRISFARRKTFSTGTGPGYLESADLDGDGKMDLVVENAGSKSLSILRNVSTTSEILFENAVDSPIGSFMYGLALGDLDGDGLPDLLASNLVFTASLTIYKNESTPGNIRWGKRSNLSKFAYPQMLHLADINGDGKLDILTETDNRKLAVLLNRTGLPSHSWMCRTSDTLTLFSELTGSRYQWEIDSGNGFRSIAESSQWQGVQTNRLRLRNMPSSRTGDRYRCIVDGRISKMQEVGFQRRWIGTTNTAWENPANWSCGQVPDRYSDVIIPAGTVVVSSQVEIRSLQVRPGARVQVKPGFQIRTLVD